MMIPLMTKNMSTPAVHGKDQKAEAGDKVRSAA